MEQVSKICNCEEQKDIELPIRVVTKNFNVYKAVELDTINQTVVVALKGDIGVLTKRFNIEDIGYDTKTPFKDIYDKDLYNNDIVSFIYDEEIEDVEKKVLKLGYITFDKTDKNYYLIAKIEKKEKEDEEEKKEKEYIELKIKIEKETPKALNFILIGNDYENNNLLLNYPDIVSIL